MPSWLSTDRPVLVYLRLPAIVFKSETHLFTYQHRCSLQEVRHVFAHLGYTLFLDSVDADGPKPTALSRRRPLTMAPGGVLLAVRPPLASHPLARLRDVPTQLAGKCLHLELPMVTQTLHVFSVYSPPAGTQSDDALRGHLISYLDTAMEAKP